MYFSWGNLYGHAKGSGYDFSQAVYDTTPAAAINADLSLSQDAARANLGAPFRMPTDAEIQELVNNCTSVWTTLKGVAGRLFTSNVNGNTLFFPAAGVYNGTSLEYSNTVGYYWSSTFYSATNGIGLSFGASVVSPAYNSRGRRYGFSVRAVAGPTVLRRSLDSISNLDVSQNEVKKDEEELKVIDAPDKPLNEDESR